VAGIEAWTEFWGLQSPDAPAVIGPAGAVGWGELAAQVQGIARSLGPGDVVAPGADGSDVLELVLGCAAAGAVLDLTGACGPDAPARWTARPATRDGGATTGMRRPLLVLPADLTPDGTVALTHHDVEALAVAGIAADGLWPADRVATTGSPVERLLAALPALHAGAAITEDDATVLHGAAPEPVAGTRLRRIVVREPAPPGIVAGWGALGVDVVLTYGPVEASGFGLREPRPGAPLVALPGRRARVVDGELQLAGAGVVAGGWLRTGRRAVEAPSGFRLADLAVAR